MTCEACIAASKRIAHEFRDCAGCHARAVARSPEFSKAVRGGRQSPEYRRLLNQVGVTHAEVKAAAISDRVCDKLMRNRGMIDSVTASGTAPNKAPQLNT